MTDISPEAVERLEALYYAESWWPPISPVLYALRAALTEAEAKIKDLTSERAFLVGFNAGWEEHEYQMKYGKPSDGDADDQSKDYDGKIEVGQEFIWEPDKPHARAIIKVTEIKASGPEDGPDDEIWIGSKTVGDDQTYWNEESRFREAVIPAPRAENEG